MNFNKIEKALKSAVESTPAIPFSEIAAMPFIKMTEHDYITAQAEEKSTVPLRRFALAVTFCLLLIIPFTGWYLHNIAVDSIVMIDVNPSIEIMTNSKDRVIGIKALNDDAREIIENNNYKNTDITTAVDSLMNSLIEYNYLGPTTDTILLSIKNKNSKKADSLMAKIDRSIRERLVEHSIMPTILRQIISGDNKRSEQATKYSISEGKMNLIQQMSWADEELTTELLSGMSIEQLLILAKEKGIDLSGILSEDLDEKERSGESDDQEDVYDDQEWDEDDADDWKDKRDDADKDDSDNEDSDEETDNEDSDEEDPDEDSDEEDDDKEASDEEEKDKEDTDEEDNDNVDSDNDDSDEADNNIDSDKEDADARDSETGDDDDDKDDMVKGSDSEGESNDKHGNDQENEEDSTDDRQAGYDNDDTEDVIAQDTEEHIGNEEDRDNTDASDEDNDEEYSDNITGDDENSGDDTDGSEGEED